MIVRYELTRNSLKEGAKHHFRYRHRKILIIRLILGIVIFSCGILLLTTGEYVIGILFTLASMIFLLRESLSVNRIVKNAFLTNPNDREIQAITSEEKIILSDGESEASTPWTIFADFKIVENGLLLYPQPNIFYWIPNTATVEKGTWQDFQTLITKKVIPKI